MDDIDVEALRKEICRTFADFPHMKKYWLAALDMYVAAEKNGESGVEKEPKPTSPGGNIVAFRRRR